MAELMVLDNTGDQRLQWDPTNSSEVRDARDRFDSFKKKGYAAYKVNKAGQEAELIHTFDPDAERLIMRPPMVGG